MLQSIERTDQLRATVVRNEASERIKLLIANWTKNTLELGAELAKAAETFPINPKRPMQRPGFAKWAAQTTGFSKGWVHKILLIHQKFGGAPERHRLGSNVLRILGAKDVPQSARIEVFDRVGKGEIIGRKEATKIAQKHRLPGPKAANQQAKEEGHPVLASDGYIYFGTDPAKAKQGADRRSMVFGVRDALKHLGGIELTGRQFLDYAFPHQLWTAEEAPIIKKALRWLSDLSEAWDARK